MPAANPPRTLVPLTGGAIDIDESLPGFISLKIGEKEEPSGLTAA
jgi:hypothetical protein